MIAKMNRSYESQLRIAALLWNTQTAELTFAGVHNGSK